MLKSTGPQLYGLIYIEISEFALHEWCILTFRETDKREKKFHGCNIDLPQEEIPIQIPFQLKNILDYLEPAVLCQPSIVWTVLQNFCDNKRSDGIAVSHGFWKKDGRFNNQLDAE